MDRKIPHRVPLMISESKREKFHLKVVLDGYATGFRKLRICVIWVNTIVSMNHHFVEFQHILTTLGRKVLLPGGPL